MRYHASRIIALIAAFAFPVAAAAQQRSAGRPNHHAGAPATGALADAADGGVASGAVIRFLWLPPQGLTADPYPPGTIGVGTPDLRLGGIPPEGQPLWLGVFISNWGAQGELANWFAQLDSVNLALGLVTFSPPCESNQDCRDLVGAGQGSGCGLGPLPVNNCAAAFIQTSRSDIERFDFCDCVVTIPSVACGCELGASEAPHPDEGLEQYVATFVIQADAALTDGPHGVEFLATSLEAASGTALTTKAPGATIAVRRGSCCYDLGLSTTTPCVSGVRPVECEQLNTGPLPQVFRDGEMCPAEGGPGCPLALGACCDSQAGALAEAGLCEDVVQYSDCQCPTCTWFEDESCAAVLAQGLCEPDFVAIPAVSEWGLAIIALVLLIGAKLLGRWRTANLGPAILPLFWAPAATAQPQASHVVRVSPEVVTQIPDVVSRASIRVDYGTFVWMELTSEDATAVENSGLPYERRFAAYVLQLGGQPFDPAAGVPALPAGWDTVRTEGPDLHLVQFVGPTKDQWLTDLRGRGLELVQYFYPFTYVVWGNAPDLPDPATMPEVRWSGPWAPAYRANPDWPAAGPARRFRIMMFRKADTQSIVAALEALGAQIEQERPLGSTFRLATVVLPPASIRAAANTPGVYSIQPVPEQAGLLGEASDQVCADNLDGNSEPVPGYAGWLSGIAGVDGTGVVMANVDCGIDDDNPDLAGRLLPCSGTTCGHDALHHHGTHTAGIMAGDGSSGIDNLGFLRGLGVAPGARLVEQLFDTTSSGGCEDPPADLTELIRQSHENNAILSSNSWTTYGKHIPCGYDSYALEIDLAVRDARPDLVGNQPFLYVQAAGNASGGVSYHDAPNDAKNIVTVGGTHLWDGLSGTDFADIGDLFNAHGPACDGRVIPHLVAPGAFVDSTWCVTDVQSCFDCADTVPPPPPPAPSEPPELHCLLSGTSMAAPHAAGAIALFVQYYREVVPGTTDDPSPALVKAALTAVARDLAGKKDADGQTLGHRPDGKQGWGQLNTATAVKPDVAVTYFDDPSDQIFDETTDPPWEQTLGAADPNEPVRVMLAWTDAPGHGDGRCPFQGQVCPNGPGPACCVDLCGCACCDAEQDNRKPAWVNNLDLEVEVGGAVYYGNDFKYGWSQVSLPGTQHDLMNNLEGVFLSAGPLSFTVRVIAANIAGDGVPGNGDETDQDFALVCYNCGPPIDNDCNGNSIDDACDVDCEAPAGCGPFCGQSNDCDFNGVPDECSHRMGPDLSGVDKNRFISFRPGYDEGSTAIRVKLVKMYHSAGGTQPTCVGGSEDGETCAEDSECAGGLCVPNCPSRGGMYPDLSQFEGEVRWLGQPYEFVERSVPPPLNFIASKLECVDLSSGSPHFRDWSVGGLLASFGGSQGAAGDADVSAVHLYGAEVVPCSVYEVQHVLQGCCSDLEDEACYSPPLVIKTARWGDVWFPYSYEEQGQPNFQDIGAVVNAYKGVAYTPGPPEMGAPPHVRALLHGNVAPIDPMDPMYPLVGKINFLDIGLTVEGYKNIPYRMPGPAACPPP